MSKLFTYTIEKVEDDFYFAEVHQLPGCHTQAKSLDELSIRLKEAIELYLEAKPDIISSKFVGIQQIEVWFLVSRPLPYRKVHKRLVELGFQPSRQRGSHVFFENSEGRTTVVPKHAGEDIGRGLIRKICKDIGIDPEDFFSRI